MKRVKRLMDIFGSVVGLALVSPAILVVFLLIWRTMGRPVIFRQPRPGLRGRPFVMYKFRTMTGRRDENGQPWQDEKRLTPVGEFLRSFSLDELPELWNVLKGDMSLVGPRPLLMRYLDRYTPDQRRRHDMKPGITGWAQVNGRNAISWEEKFNLDIWYVRHPSLWLDVKIITLTIWKILRREGVKQPGQATAEEYFGVKG